LIVHFFCAKTCWLFGAVQADTEASKKAAIIEILFCMKPTLLWLLMLYHDWASPWNFHPHLFRPAAPFDLANCIQFAAISTPQQDKKSCGQNSKSLPDHGI
jgi:hypothetical protein